VVPLDAELPVPPLHGFWLFDDELLTIEVLHTEITTSDPTDVQLYRSTVDALWTAAAEGDVARAVLQRVLGDIAPAG
jgi:hypothetical protein